MSEHYKTNQVAGRQLLLSPCTGARWHIRRARSLLRLRNAPTTAIAPLQLPADPCGSARTHPDLRCRHCGLLLPVRGRPDHRPRPLYPRQDHRSVRLVPPVTAAVGALRLLLQPLGSMRPLPLAPGRLRLAVRPPPVSQRILHVTAGAVAGGLLGGGVPRRGLGEGARGAGGHGRASESRQSIEDSGRLASGREIAGVGTRAESGAVVEASPGCILERHHAPQ